MDFADSTFFIILALGFVAWFLLKQKGQINMSDAAQLLEQGAILIDVRSKTEYAQNGLKEAVNLPLENVAMKISTEVPDQKQVILCHCQSGMRSASAVSQLRKLGYRAHNLGSYTHARKVVESRYV